MKTESPRGVLNSLQRLRGRLAYFRSLPAFHSSPIQTICRAVSWRLRCAFGIPAVRRIEALNCRFFFPPKWSGGGATLFFVAREKYEPELTFLSKLVEPGQTVVDIGASLGIFTVACAALTGRTGKVLAFEPSTSAFETLEKNIALNGYEHVQAFRVALSNEEGEASLYSETAGQVSASLGKTGGVSERVKLTTLDTVLEGVGVDSVDVIKIDVEGAEELVFRGAERLFSRCLPKVIFEVNPPAARTLSLAPDGAWDFLAACGYTFFSFTDTGSLIPATVPQEVCNIVALPPEAPR